MIQKQTWKDEIRILITDEENHGSVQISIPLYVRYWDTYPDRVIATCDTEEEAEKICNEYRRNRKPMYDYLVRKENE